MTACAAKIGAIAPWAGGKRRLAPEIVRLLGPHRSYFEPFCGGLAVLLAKPSASSETANDLHGDVINLARVLADEPLAFALYGRLSRVLMVEALHTEAAERVKDRRHDKGGAPDQPDLDAAYDYMLCAWIGRNGVAGTQSYNQGFCVRYTKNGGHAATRWSSAVDSIPAWHDRLRGVTFTCRDSFELVARWEDAPGVAIYVDPPYVNKGFPYVHDFDDAAHVRLAEALGRFKRTRVVVSYYEHPRVRELYDGWRFKEIEVSKSLGAVRQRDGRNHARATELLISNAPAALFED